MSSFREKCQRRGWTKSTRPTHLLMNGGKLVVPQAQYDDFLRVYLKCLQREPLAVVEVKAQFYCIVVDLDYKCLVSDERVQQHAQALRETVKRLTDRDLPVMVHQRPDEDGESGCHLYVPELIVHSRTALPLATELVLLLRELEPELDWSKIIDQRIYKGTGVRLPYSSKCRDGAFIGRVYRPTFWDSGEPVQLSELEVLHACSLRRDSSDVVNLEHKPSSLQKEQATTLNKFLKLRFGTAFKRTRCKRLQPQLLIVSTDCKDCPNLSSRHRTSTLYYVVRPSGVVQRCRCNCPERSCSRYSSREMKLTDELLLELFDMKPRLQPVAPMYNVFEIPRQVLIERIYGPQKRSLDS